MSHIAKVRFQIYQSKYDSLMMQQWLSRSSQEAEITDAFRKTGYFTVSL